MPRDPIGSPFLVNLDQAKRPEHAHALRREKLDEGIDEAWLQELLNAQPSLLPVTSIDERIQEPLTSLGMEIGTPTGSIDILFISANGYLVIVETKLWRNAEARRKVVAQILDYAAQLRQWDYSMLQRQWQKQCDGSASLWEHVRPEDRDEPEWIDLVNENLSAGRMCLLIIGDGIRSEARQLAEAVSGHPDFQFRLGMVELRLFRLEEGRVLVIPTTLAKTQEIQRAIVRIEQGPAGETKVHVETAVEGREQPQPRSVLTEEAFFDEVRRSSPNGQANERVARRLLSLLRDAGLTIDWQRASFSVKYPDPSESGIMFSLAHGYKNGQFGCWTSILLPQLLRAFEDEETGHKIGEKHISWLREIGAKGKKDIGIDMSELAGREEHLIKWLEATVAEIHAAARSE